MQEPIVKIVTALETTDNKKDTTVTEVVEYNVAPMSIQNSTVTTAREPWEAIVQRKRAQRDAKIPGEWQIPEATLPAPNVLDVSDFPHSSGLFSQRELELTAATASEVVAKIASREWTSEEVTRAVCKRAAVAQQLLNCVTEICFEEAIARAKELDQILERDGKPLGPLHGLPVSLKDQFHLPGLDSTIGYVAFAEKPATEASTLVKLLSKAGAVFYVKTNVPTTLMMGQSVNQVFGTTVHPRNRDLTSGGSSGGEAALISFGGSYMGVGTDIGGSIRHPCSFTGLYGLRPSHGRVPYQHVNNTYRGQEALRSCAGPMCRSPEDVRMFMTTVAAQEPWLEDPQCLPMPWRTELEALPKQLCFGFSTSDGRVDSTPPLRRAMEIAKTKLAAAGHKLIEFPLPEMEEACEIAFRMYGADGGEEFQQDCDASGEPLPKHISDWLAATLDQAKTTVFETWQNQSRRSRLAQKWLARWQSTAAETGTGRPIDGLLMPSFEYPATRHGREYPSDFGAFSPLLDLTTASFPVTQVDPDKDQYSDNFKPLSKKDQTLRDAYECAENHVGSYVGLSVVGRRLEEEKVTAMLHLLSEVVGVDYDRARSN